MFGLHGDADGLLLSLLSQKKRVVESRGDPLWCFQSHAFCCASTSW